MGLYCIIFSWVKTLTDLFHPLSLSKRNKLPGYLKHNLILCSMENKESIIESILLSTNVSVFSGIQKQEHECWTHKVCMYSCNSLPHDGLHKQCIMGVPHRGHSVL